MFKYPKIQCLSINFVFVDFNCHWKQGERLFSRCLTEGCNWAINWGRSIQLIPDMLIKKCGAAFVLSLVCFSSGQSPGKDPAAQRSSLREALTFHASFDETPDANFAKGDPKIYFLAKGQSDPKEGLPDSIDHVAHEKGAGRIGDCLRFKTNQAPRIFFKAKDNLVYLKENWQGTFSFWLSTTPDEDLAPGYTDPIQITPRSALDACLFFEFGIEDPRPCRLGVFPDKTVWNPKNIPGKEFPLTARPLISVTSPPFSRDRWTHVVFTFRGFNNDDTKAVARLYLDGIPRGDLMNWKQQFTWDLDEAQIRLGVKFVGRIDEISVFSRELTVEEVKALYEPKLKENASTG